jgi:hypothetical protein
MGDLPRHWIDDDGVQHGGSTVDANGNRMHIRTLGHITRIDGQPTGNQPLHQSAKATPMTATSEVKTQAEWFQRGVDAATMAASKTTDLAVRAFTDRVLRAMDGGIAHDRTQSTDGTWRGFKRAVEHIVTDLDPSAAATPHGIVPLGTSWALELANTWTDEALRATAYATLIEATEPGVPTLPLMSTPSTAGAQGGEKKALYSKAFTIDPDPNATVIDSTLYLNVSGLVEGFGLLALTEAIMRASVAAEANRQVSAAMTAQATSGADIGAAFGAFEGGRYQPSVVVIPPSAIATVDASNLTAAGIKVVVDASATATLVVDPSATIGWFRRLSMQADEPTVFGKGVAAMVYGYVSVDPAGVAKVAGP